MYIYLCIHLTIYHRTFQSILFLSPTKRNQPVCSSLTSLMSHIHFVYINSHLTPGTRFTGKVISFFLHFEYIIIFRFFHAL